MTGSEERRWLKEVTARLPTGGCAGCHQCASRCVAGIRITRTEYESISEFLGGCEPFPVARRNGQMKAPCGFRDPDGGGCVIYPVRPLICRLFGLVEWLPCPVERMPVLVEDGPKIMQQYSTLQRRTYRQWRRQGRHADNAND